MRVACAQRQAEEQRRPFGQNGAAELHGVVRGARGWTRRNGYRRGWLRACVKAPLAGPLNDPWLRPLGTLLSDEAKPLSEWPSERP
jgi:hypothetical protein